MDLYCANGTVRWVYHSPLPLCECLQDTGSRLRRRCAQVSYAYWNELRFSERSALRPLPGCVQHTQHAHQVADHVVDQDVILMRYQLAGTSNTTKPAKAGMINQAAGLFCKQFIESQRGGRVVGLDVVIDFVAVLCRLWSPE